MPSSCTCSAKYMYEYTQLLLTRQHKTICSLQTANTCIHTWYTHIYSVHTQYYYPTHHKPFGFPLATNTRHIYVHVTNIHIYIHVHIYTSTLFLPSSMKILAFRKLLTFETEFCTSVLSWMATSNMRAIQYRTVVWMCMRVCVCVCISKCV